MQPLLLPHIPQLYSWVNWSNVGEVPCSRKQQQTASSRGSSGSQANPKPLPLLPHKAARKKALHDHYGVDCSFFEGDPVCMHKHASALLQFGEAFTVSDNELSRLAWLNN